MSETSVKLVLATKVKSAVVSALISIAFVSQAFAVLRPLVPAKPAPPFNGELIIIGDDQQSATNYPLVRITNNATGHVFYSRTHDHSSMAVGFNGLVSTHFDVPANQELGASMLEVVANGIPSAPVPVVVH